MKEIQCSKFSLFRLEKTFLKGLDYIGEFNNTITANCFEYIDTYDTLELAQSAQKKIKNKTIILPSY